MCVHARVERGLARGPATSTRRTTREESGTADRRCSFVHIVPRTVLRRASRQPARGKRSDGRYAGSPEQTSRASMRKDSHDDNRTTRLCCVSVMNGIRAIDSLRCARADLASDDVATTRSCHVAPTKCSVRGAVSVSGPLVSRPRVRRLCRRPRGGQRCRWRSPADTYGEARPRELLRPRVLARHTSSRDRWTAVCGCGTSIRWNVSPHSPVTVDGSHAPWTRPSWRAVGFAEV